MPVTARDLASTQRFIDYRPLAVVVQRSNRVATPDGGHTTTPLPDLAAQTVRIVEKLPTQATTQRTNESGDTVFADKVAIAMPSADFQRKDMFTAYGELWEVLHVSRLPEWRLSMELYSHGTFP